MIKQISVLKDFLITHKKQVFITMILIFGLVTSLYMIRREQILRSNAYSNSTIKLQGAGDTYHTNTLQFQIQFNQSDFPAPIANP